MQHKIALPCSPLVREYLHKNFGNPVRLTRKQPIGKYFYTLLANPCLKREKRVNTYEQSVTVIISHNEFRHCGWKLTKNDIVEINNMITEQVYGLMYVAIEARQDLVKADEFKIKYAIEWFFKYMNFPPDAVSIETAVKAYYRFREKRDNKEINI